MDQQGCGTQNSARATIRKGLLLGAAFQAFIAPAAMAQQSAEADGAESASGNVIIVEARKRSESVQEVPVALNVVSGETLTEGGIADLRDLTTLLPSVTFDRSVSQGDFRPAIRGLQAEVGRTSVGILVDGIDNTSENLQGAGGGFLANQRLLDVAQVEVVKGPQAALYGRSAFGGAINYISKRPNLTAPEFSASAEGTSEESFEGRAAVSVPLVADRLGLRVNGYLWDDRGSFRNEKSGDYVGGGSGYGIAASLLARPLENLEFLLKLGYSDDEFAPQAAFLNAGNTTVNLTANQQAVVGQPTATIFTGEVTPAAIFFDVDPRTGKDYPGADNQVFRASLITEIDLDGVLLTSLSSYIESDYSVLQDNDFLAAPNGAAVVGGFQETDRSNAISQLSQEIRLQSDNDSPFQWLVGGLFWRENLDQLDATDAGTTFIGPISQADLDFFQINGSLDPREFGRETEHYSAFFWLEYDLTDRFSASVEGRYVSETIDYSVNQLGSNGQPFGVFFGVQPGATDGAPIFFPFVTVNAVDSARIEEDYFIPKATLSYELSDSANLYASVGKGIKPGGFETNALAGGFTDGVRYDRETLWSYEAGLKTQWLDNRITLNSAFFYQDYSDQQVSSQVFNQDLMLLQPIIENAGKSTIWGIEIESSFDVTNQLSLALSYTYLNAQFDQFEVVSTSASRIAELPDCQLLSTPGAPPACVLDRSGKRPADLPKHRAIAQVKYTDTLSGTWDWFTQANVSYNGEEFADTSNVLIQGDVTNVDLTMGVTNGDWRIAGFVTNLTDDDTITDANLYVDFRAGFSPNAFGYLPDPRTWGLRVSFDY